MSKLSVRTVTDLSPQGKPRVWFSCHPADFGKHFEEICEDIFTTQNCAIYYETEPKAGFDETELASQLSDMQLFVVVITTKFLFSDNRACSYEYRYAMENHIPILPIAVEPGIADIFTERMNHIGAGYGDVQLLDRTSTDITAIPYAEKLSKQLDVLLVGDERAARVRAAFDAYIFLSYRKKDRIYAKELMRLIHRIPFCRDIAIWYDEFLVPGEGWNDAIKDAMQKSSLVTLAVTPNVTEPDNWIIKNEYPDAVKMGKEVIPAELVATDRDLLSRLFKDIQLPVDGNDENAMAEALKSIAIKENNPDPEHNFLIGLAYLGGIDVERDNEHAVSMITVAAEAGLPEAIEKLVSMYANGDGVERNYLTSVYWQEKLVAALERAENPLEDDNLIWCLANLGEMREALGQFKEAREAYERMQKYAEERYNQMPKAVETRRCLATSFERMGDLSKEEGNTTAAGDYYKRCLEIREQLADETGTHLALSNLGLSYDCLGELCQSAGDFAVAGEYYEKALAIREHLKDESGTIEEWQDLSVSYDRLGKLYATAGDFTTAKGYYEKCYEICKRMVVEAGTLEALRDLTGSFMNLGDLCKAEGDLVAAEEYYEKVLETRKQLADETDAIADRRNLTLVYDKLGDLYAITGEHTTALEYYNKGFEIKEQILNECETIEALHNLFVSYDRMGDIYKAEKNHATAKEYYKRALEIGERLIDETDTMVARYNFSVNCNKLGEIYRAEHDFTVAEEYYEKAFEISKQLVDESSTIEHRRGLYSCYINWGSLHKDEGNLDAAKKYFLAALDISAQLVVETESPDSYYEVVLALVKMSTVKDDIDLVRRAYKISRDLTRQYPSIAKYATINRMIKNDLQRRKKERPSFFDKIFRRK